MVFLMHSATERNSLLQNAWDSTPIALLLLIP